MTTVFHELLPESYLLLLTPGKTQDPELALEHSLRCASRSGKTAVWVDCELVNDLSTEAVRMLCDYHHRLQEQHMKLVVVHACDEIKHRILQSSQNEAEDLCFVPTLIDAAWQSGQRLVA